MTDETFEPRLWTKTGFRADRWVRVESLDGVDADTDVIVSLETFLSLDEAALEERKSHLGVELQPGEALDTVADKLGKLALVALAFPAFADGRSYSKAQLLRTRHHFAGVIRATGEVLIDQIAHMLRTGFDEFEITNEVAAARLSAGAPGGLGRHYQPAATPAPAAASYSWRRVTPSAGEQSPHIHHY